MALAVWHLALVAACGDGVEPPRPHSVATVLLSVDSAHLKKGATLEIVATLRDSNGRTLTGRDIRWSSSAPTVASVAGSSDRAFVGAIAPGRAQITATSEGKSRTAVVVVDAPVPNIAGIWSLKYYLYYSGGLGYEDHFVVELSQHEDSVVGGIGGSANWCLVSFGCQTTTLYRSRVSGWVRPDSVVGLQWQQDSAYVEAQGKVQPGGTFGSPLNPSWQAQPESTVSVSLAKLRASDTVIVRGVITVSAGAFEGGTLFQGFVGDVVYVQDGSAGVEVVGLLSDASILLGDSVLVRGVSQDDGFGERAIVPFARYLAGIGQPPQLAFLGRGTVPLPRVVTVPEVRGRAYEGNLVTVRSVRLHSKPSSATGGYDITFEDSTGTTFPARVHASVATTVSLGSWVLGATYDLTGILGSSGGTANLQLRAPGDRVRR